MPIAKTGAGGGGKGAAAACFTLAPAARTVTLRGIEKARGATRQGTKKPPCGG